MKRSTRGMALLLACQFQAILYLAAGWYGAVTLNEKYPISYDWLMLTMPLSVILIGHSFYIVVRFLMQKDRRDSKGIDRENK